METVLVVIHLMVVLALVGVVLLQRSEGGGLGIGGGSGFMTARGAANALTRATAILAAAFFATSLLLSILARYGERPIDILERVPGAGGATQQAPGTGGGILDQLGGSGSQSAPPAPAETAPATAPAAVPAPASDAAPAVPAPAAPATNTAPAAPEGAQAPVQPATPLTPQAPITPQVPTGQ
jgi:preprotein translocase subunit SecG